MVPAPLLLMSSLLALLAGLLEVVHDGGVCEGAGIAEVVLALGHATEDAAHDPAAPLGWRLKYFHAGTQPFLRYHYSYVLGG